jgi:hypothetical protein
VIGETNLRDKKIPLRILFDTGSNSSIILHKFMNKNTLVKTKRQLLNGLLLVENSILRNREQLNLNYLNSFFLKTIEFKLHVDETTVHANASYDMIIGRDLITELKLALDFDTQCITWDGIDQPMKIQGGLQKVITHYEDLYSALMGPAITVFKDDYAKASEPEHVRAEKKRQTRILDANYEAADLKEIIESISTINDIEKINFYNY